MKIKLIALSILTLMVMSCTSTKSTLKNVDDNAPVPKVSSQNTFVITENSKDKKYGYDADYPVNVYYRSAKYDSINQLRYLKALAGPNGENLSYKKIETCCPFPTKKNEMGAGFLDVYEITWKGNQSPIKLYLNSYEKGALLVPIGLTVKK